MKYLKTFLASFLFLKIVQMIVGEQKVRRVWQIKQRSSFFAALVVQSAAKRYCKEDQSFSIDY